MLFSSPPLVINVEAAVALGLNEAIILQQVHYWLQKNVGRERSYREGYYWTYNSYEGWREQFSFWSLNTIKRAIAKLEKWGILVTGNFNKMKMDRTKWYRIDYEVLEKFCDSIVSGIGGPKMGYSIGPKWDDAQIDALVNDSPENVSEYRDIEAHRNMRKLVN